MDFSPAGGTRGVSCTLYVVFSVFQYTLALDCTIVYVFEYVARGARARACEIRARYRIVTMYYMYNQAPKCIEKQRIQHTSLRSDHRHSE